jgi:hypothetical protein
MVSNGSSMPKGAKLTGIQLSVVSKGQPGLGQLDIATVFAKNIFGNDIAPRVMAGMIAFSIFGHIVVMTFTASRGETNLFCIGVLQP